MNLMLKMPLLGSMLRTLMDLVKANQLNKTSKQPLTLTIKMDTTSFLLPLLSQIKSNLSNLIKTKKVMVSSLTMVKPHLLNNLLNRTLHGTNGAHPNGKQVPIFMAFNQNQTMTSATEAVFLSTY